jgi:hypothetical protein
LTFLRLLAAATLAAIAPLSAARAAAPAPAPASLTVTAAEGFVIPVQVNGRTLRLRVDPGTARIVLNASAAAAARLTGSIFGARAQIGPIRVNGETSLTRVAIGDWRVRRRVMWFGRDAVAGADGIIGMSMMPYETITMALREPRGDDVPITVPVVQDGQYGLVHRHLVGGETMKVHFRFFQQFSQATASAGAHLAFHNGGTWSGEPTERPLLLGVMRPVRPMRFAPPLSFGGLRMESLLVRTGDFRGGYVLPTDPPAAASTDPDEIVVTGNTRRGRAQLVVLIGDDVASRCSAVTYRRTARTLTLTCPAAMAG